MAYELRELSGSLFPNKRKQEGDNKPHFEGDCMIGGVKYRVAAWTKPFRDGEFHSLKFSLPNEHPREGESVHHNRRPDSLPGQIQNDDGTPW